MHYRMEKIDLKICARKYGVLIYEVLIYETSIMQARIIYSIGYLTSEWDIYTTIYSVKSDSLHSPIICHTRENLRTDFTVWATLTLLYYNSYNWL